MNFRMGATNGWVREDVASFDRTVRHAKANVVQVHRANSSKVTAGRRDLAGRGDRMGRVVGVMRSFVMDGVRRRIDVGRRGRGRRKVRRRGKRFDGGRKTAMTVISPRLCRGFSFDSH